MKIPFCKAHGAKNDFLLTWAAETSHFTPQAARAICDRYTGVGADGWMLVDDAPSIRLLNSDGSEAELSGNGTRCAAAFLIHSGKAADKFSIRTGAGEKQLRLIERQGLKYVFEMNMGMPRVIDPRFRLPLRAGSREVTLVDVGNPQCVLLVPNFEVDWRALGAEIESHAHFPRRTNVSFVRRVDNHTIDVRFYERGAGQTMSSGTGSTGAVVAAVTHGWVQSPVTVITPAGNLALRWEGDMFLTGPAEIVAEGVFHYDEA